VEFSLVILLGLLAVAAAAILGPRLGISPQRALLIFVAFLVATFSLLLQGGTLPWVVRLVRPARLNGEAMREEQSRLKSLLVDASDQALSRHASESIVQQFRERLKQVDTASGGNGEPAVTEVYRRVRSDVVHAQREALMTARDEGTFSAGTLTAVLEALDAEEISMELRLTAARS
jgi:NhaP-type Na+/H+ or K+/H+ antiporter